MRQRPTARSLAAACSRPLPNPQLPAWLLTPSLRCAARDPHHPQPCAVRRAQRGPRAPLPALQLPASCRRLWAAVWRAANFSPAVSPLLLPLPFLPPETSLNPFFLGHL